MAKLTDGWVPGSRWVRSELPGLNRVELIGPAGVKYPGTPLLPLSIIEDMQGTTYVLGDGVVPDVTQSRIMQYPNGKNTVVLEIEVGDVIMRGEHA